MARRPPASEPPSAQMSPLQMERGIGRLQRQLNAITQFDPRSVDPSDPWSTLRPFTTAIETALSETFGYNTVEYKRFRSAGRFNWPTTIYDRTPPQLIIKHVAQDRQKTIDLLNAAIALLKERLEETTESSAAIRMVAPTESIRVFIVHGRDDGRKEAVARLLQHLGLDPVILHERPNRGRTLITKFQEESADVGFAVVLMTADDTGGLADGELRPRARQNVILELGFFLGRLGPERVATLVDSTIERPSDFDGVVYIEADQNGMWKYRLAHELKAAGYNVDLNNIS
jgi:Predicted nucleotide-binding protein containing TIR -like domain